MLPARPASRKGVPQDRQAHVLLHRGLIAAEELLPGLQDDLIRHGGVTFDSGTMPWLGEYGWLPTWIPSYEFISTTRPLLELLVRQRVRALDGVRIHDGVRVSELRQRGHGWRIECADSTVLDAVADLPWSVAVTEDLRQPSSTGRQNVGQRLLGAWTAEVTRLAAHGDQEAYHAFARVYHLMGSPLLLFHPALFASAARSVLRGRPPAAPRPAVLDALTPAGPQDRGTS